MVDKEVQTQDKGMYYPLPPPFLGVSFVAVLMGNKKEPFSYLIRYEFTITNAK